jgi:hypothetical protein
MGKSLSLPDFSANLGGFVQGDDCSAARYSRLRLRHIKIRRTVALTDRPAAPLAPQQEVQRCRYVVLRLCRWTERSHHRTRIADLQNMHEIGDERHQERRDGWRAAWPQPVEMQTQAGKPQGGFGNEAWSAEHEETEGTAVVSGSRQPALAIG